LNSKKKTDRKKKKNVVGGKEVYQRERRARAKSERAPRDAGPKRKAYPQLSKKKKRGREKRNMPFKKKGKERKGIKGEEGISAGIDKGQNNYRRQYQREGIDQKFIG